MTLKIFKTKIERKLKHGKRITNEVLIKKFYQYFQPYGKLITTVVEI